MLEIANSIPKNEIKGRTDWLEGLAFKLTLEQAEALYLELGASLVSVKSLINSGKIKVKT